MTDDSPMEEAAEHGEQAAEHAKAAAQEAARAAKAVAEPVVDRVSAAAEDTAEKLEGTAEDALGAARRVSRALTGDTGVGFLALTVCVYSGTVAFYKFRSAFEGRGTGSA